VHHSKIRCRLAAVGHSRRLPVPDELAACPLCLRSRPNLCVQRNEARHIPADGRPSGCLIRRHRGSRRLGNARRPFLNRAKHQVACILARGSRPHIEGMGIVFERRQLNPADDARDVDPVLHPAVEATSHPSTSMKSDARGGMPSIPIPLTAMALPLTLDILNFYCWRVLCQTIIRLQCYQLWHVAVDGFEARRRLPGEARVPRGSLIMKPRSKVPRLRAPATVQMKVHHNPARAHYLLIAQEFGGRR
jgi:hypothetical protein